MVDVRQAARGVRALAAGPLCVCVLTDLTAAQHHKQDAIRAAHGALIDPSGARAPLSGTNAA
jgi:hypothetical protein